MVKLNVRHVLVTGIVSLFLLLALGLILAMQPSRNTTTRVVVERTVELTAPAVVQTVVVEPTASGPLTAATPDSTSTPCAEKRIEGQLVFDLHPGGTLMGTHLAFAGQAFPQPQDTGKTALLRNASDRMIEVEIGGTATLLCDTQSVPQELTQGTYVVIFYTTEDTLLWFRNP